VLVSLLLRPRGVEKRGADRRQLAAGEDGRGSSFSRRFTSSTDRWATARVTLAIRSFALPLLHAHLLDCITGRELVCQDIR
jgi:hypothetical protein